MFSEQIAAVLFAAKTMTVVFGGVLAYLSYRAYRRTASIPLRTLSIGIGLLTVGALLGGTLHHLVGISLETSVGVQSVVTATGFAVMTYSLFADTPTDESRTSSGIQPGDWRP
ncbi:MAG: hypothetical protein ACI8XM_002388 [Haloarculaceae archaeon]|jgi:hypothetical protein